VITNATVITMDSQLGDIANGSVHVRNGTIVAVGADVSAAGAMLIDAQDRVVMPGLIDTHWHMWHTLFRGMSGDKRENGRAGSEFKLTARRALELATVDAARIIGVDKQIGSLTPGKRADIIMVATDALNMAVASDPVHLVVEATQPENVDTVIVDGRILKRGGKLTAAQPAEVAREARIALAEVRKRANWR
jgi:cytosine/adenosine deaminase-related metal-dependent hydrolase